MMQLTGTRNLNKRGTANYTRAPLGIPIEMKGTSAFDQFVLGWLSCLMNPEDNMVRIPDAYGGKTALVRDIVEFEIPAYYNAADTTNNGKFSCMMQPILGNPSSVGQYSLYISTPALWTNADWSLPANYQGDNNTSDPRQLRITARFCSQEPGYFAGAGSGLFTNAIPLGDNPLNVSNQSYNVSVYYDPLTGILTIPPGTWNYTVIVIGTTLNTFAVGPSTTVTQGPTAVQTAPTLAVICGVITSGATSANQNLINFVFTSAATITSASIFLSPAYSDGVASNLNAGIFQRIRPVAMSGLLTATQPPLTAGGRTHACLIPAETANSHYFQQARGSQLQEISYISGLEGDMSGDYNGGAYCWWSPRTNLDTSSIDINQSNDYDFPNIVFTGQYTPSGTVPTSSIPIYRLRCVRIFEVEISSTVLELQPCIGNNVAYDAVLNASGILKHATFNRTHTNYIRNAVRQTDAILRSSKKLYREHSDIIDPLVKGLAGLAVSALTL